MKRGIVLSFLLAIVLTGLFAQEAWQWDADRADGYFSAGDYDAAWLFYERALGQGCDDGLIVYRAAESFRMQEMTDNPEYGDALYAVAAHFLQDQYPDNPAYTAAASYVDESTIVNRRFLRQTYAVVGAKAPKARRPVSEGFGSVSGFFASRVEELGQFVLILRSEGIRDAFSWARGRAWSLILSVLIVNALTGIILPIVMAVTVAREGRKSYVTAYAFLFHWGLLGIHRFYLGRYTSGVIWLLTGGLLGVGVFFDLFLTGAYIRFWNEDNRGDRPAPPSHSGGRVKQQKVKKQKVQKVKKQKVQKVKAPKPAKVAKPAKPARESKKTRTPIDSDASSKIAEEEGFSFAAAASSASAAAAVASAEAVEAPDLEPVDDFGDLSDLSFDDDIGDDFSISPESSDDDFSAELPEELDENDFDIKSFE